MARCRAGRCPTVCAWIVSAAGVQRAFTTPDDHFTASPDCRVTVSCRGRVDGAGGSPAVRARIVSSASVDNAAGRHMSTPDDHFTAGPDCRVKQLGQWAHWWCWWLSNCRCRDCISRRCSKSAVSSAPDDHFTAGPYCRVIVSASGRVGGAGGCPTIRAGIVSPAGVQIVGAIRFRPRRSFHCRSTLPCDDSSSGRIGGAGGRPAIRAGIVSPAGVEIATAIIATPDDHFTASPYCRVTISGSGRVCRAGRCPTVCAGIVSPAGVEIAVLPSLRPRRSFHCQSTLPYEDIGQSGALSVLVAVQVSSVHSIGMFGRV